MQLDIHVSLNTDFLTLDLITVTIAVIKYSEALHWFFIKTVQFGVTFQLTIDYLFGSEVKLGSLIFTHSDWNKECVLQPAYVNRQIQPSS